MSRLTQRLKTLAAVASFALLIQLAYAEQADQAEHYVIDTPGAHAFIQFKISHLGFSWLYGRFNDFDGHFTFNPSAPEQSAVEVNIRTASIDSNHARRDDHLRNEDFLDVSEFPDAHFRSTAFHHIEGDRYHMVGELTFMGITRQLEMNVEQVGAGVDPWGNYRRGFHARTQFALADFGIDYNLGPDARVVEIILDVEGIRQDES